MKITVDNYTIDNSTTYWGQDWEPEFLNQFFEEGEGRHNVRVEGRVALDSGKEFELTTWRLKTMVEDI
jgi:hypothetical protein